MKGMFRYYSGNGIYADVNGSHVFDTDICFTLVIIAIFFLQVIFSSEACTNNDYYDWYFIFLSIILDFQCFTDKTFVQVSYNTE